MKNKKIDLKLIATLLILAPALGNASGGYPSTGKNLSCRISLTADTMTKDAPEIFVVFSALNGDLVNGVKGVLKSPRIGTYNQLSDDVDSRNSEIELARFAKKMNFEAAVSYKNKVITMNLKSSVKNWSQTSEQDLSAGIKGASEIIELEAMTPLSNKDVTVTGEFECSADTVQSSHGANLIEIKL